MRFWSLHPCYLDTKRLTAQWREGLLCLKCLDTRIEKYGYRNHPQVTRWPMGVDGQHLVANYLYHVHHEAFNRDYNFNWERVTEKLQQELFFDPIDLIPITIAQLNFEAHHLTNKLTGYSPFNSGDEIIQAHPMFSILDDQFNLMEWERGHL